MFSSLTHKTGFLRGHPPPIPNPVDTTNPSSNTSPLSSLLHILAVRINSAVLSDLLSHYYTIVHTQFVFCTFQHYCIQFLSYRAVVYQYRPHIISYRALFFLEPSKGGKEGRETDPRRVRIKETFVRSMPPRPRTWLELPNSIFGYTVRCTQL